MNTFFRGGVALCTADTESSGSPSLKETAHFLLKGKRAVVAEDQGVTQLQLRHILRSIGIEVVGTAADGREAIDVVLQTRPDLVLMDVQMPVMDGLEAARRILEKLQVCIVMLTAFSDPEHEREARSSGACGYVIKPVTAASLIPQLIDSFREYRNK